MRKLIAIASLAALAACGPSSTVEQSRNASIDVKAIDVAGKAARCLPWKSLSLSQQTVFELKGELRTRFLNPKAEQAGARAFVSPNTVSDYGSIIVYYTNSDGSCLLFAETLGMQEYTIKAGLDPMVVTTGYERQPATPVAAPAPAPITQ